MDILPLLELLGVTSLGGLALLGWKFWKASREFKAERKKDRAQQEEEFKKAYEADLLSKGNQKRIGALESDLKKERAERLENEEKFKTARKSERQEIYKRFDGVRDEMEEVRRNQAVTDTKLEERTGK